MGIGAPSESNLYQLILGVSVPDITFTVILPFSPNIKCWSNFTSRKRELPTELN